jgi:hypothetical protein
VLHFETDTNRKMSDEQDSLFTGAPPALSVRQPWAELVISGRKSIEVREWWTEYRGPLWIHAGLTQDVETEHKFGFEQLFRGGFVGRVTLTAIVRFDSDRWTRWRERHLSDGAMPRTAYGWIVKDPLRLKEPFPARGFPGLFRPSLEVTLALQALLPENEGTEFD